MRISDWSSDVCSSDLAVANGLLGGGNDARIGLDIRITAGQTEDFPAGRSRSADALRHLDGGGWLQRRAAPGEAWGRGHGHTLEEECSAKDDNACGRDGAQRPAAGEALRPRHARHET